MLTRKEKIVMNFLIEKCGQTDSCLVTYSDVKNILVPKYVLNNIEIDELLHSLVLDNMITVVNSDKKGTPVLCITLKEKGASFKRNEKNNKKNFGLIVARTVLLAVVSFAVGMILRSIFKW